MRVVEKDVETIASMFLLLCLSVWAIFISQQPIPELTGDPANIVERSVRVASTGDVYSTVDPPFRYIPLAILHTLLGIDSVGRDAAAVTHLYSAAMSFVVLPGLLYLLVRAVIGRWVAFLTLFGFVSFRALGIGFSPYMDGYWMYDYAIPLFFLALLIAHYSVNSESNHKPGLLAVLAGITIGATGLTQYILGAYAAGAVGLIYLYHQKYRELVVAGGISVLMTTPLLFMSDYAKQYISSAGAGRLGLLSLSDSMSVVVYVFTTPAHYIIILPALSAIVGYRWTGRRPSESGVIGIAVVVLCVGWITKFVLTSGWFALLSQYAVQYLLLALAIHQGIAVVDEFGYIRRVQENLSKIAPIR